MIVVFVLLKLSCPKLYIILYKMLLIYIKLYPLKHPLKIKNPVKLVLYRVLSGVGENRTLVQTSNQKDFYALSF
jgi:hypothetical protein